MSKGRDLEGAGFYASGLTRPLDKTPQLAKNVGGRSTRGGWEVRGAAPLSLSTSAARRCSAPRGLTNPVARQHGSLSCVAAGYEVVYCSRFQVLAGTSDEHRRRK
jgi:hypothetical protein